MDDLPALDRSRLPAGGGAAPLRFLLLYGSARPRSLSHLLVEEAARLLRHLGGEAEVFDPAGLPTFDALPGGSDKVRELHQAIRRADAQLWCSPENYGGLSAVMKAMLDFCPHAIDGTPLFGGQPLATAQICGAGQSYNTIGALATAGRWLGMFVTPTLLCVPFAQNEFGEDGRMKASPHFDRLVALCEELFRTTLALRPERAALVDRYSARPAGGA